MSTDRLREPGPPERSEQTAARQAQILEQVHDAVISMDLNGIIQSWNPAAVRLYGWSAGEAIGRYIGMLCFSEDLHMLEQEVLAPLAATGSHETTLRTRHKSGRAAYVALRLSLLRDESGQAVGLLGCSNDITKQKQASEALQKAKSSADESHALLTTLFRTAPVGLAFLDCDLRFIYINEALAEIDGISASDHLGRSVNDMVPKLTHILEPLYRSVIDTRIPVVNHEVCGETVAQPGKLRHWLISYYPVEAGDGTVLGVGVVVAEVTERIEAQEAIRRERDFAESLIHTAQSIVLVLDPQGRIVRFNPFMEKLSGYRLEEVQGKDWFSTFLPKRDQRRIRQLFRQAVQKIETRGNVNPIVTKDGSERQISWWDKTLTDAKGEVVGLLCMGHDITDALEAQNRALRTQRLAAIGQTIATIAHESRNELAVIGLAQESLAESMGDDPQQIKAISLLRESRLRLNHLFQDLRNYIAPVTLRCTECDVSLIWRRAWASLQPQKDGRCCVLNEQITVQNVSCMADALRIEQVFRNLFENALEACSDPVEIDITCSGMEDAGKRFLRVSVRDNGPGVKASQRENLFDPFYTTKPEGTGLGLTIVEHVAEAHGGTIAISGASHSGAEFILTLPQSG